MQNAFGFSWGGLFFADLSFMLQLKMIFFLVIFSISVVTLSVLQGRQGALVQAQSLIEQQLEFFAPQISSELASSQNSATLNLLSQQWQRLYPFVDGSHLAINPRCQIHSPVINQGKLIRVISVCFSQGHLLVAAVKSPQTLVSLFVLGIVSFILVVARQREFYRSESYRKVLVERELRLQMVQSLSHDLKAPLQSLLIFAKGAVASDDQLFFLSQAIDRLKELIHNLNSKNDHQSDEGSPRERVYNLNDLISEYEHRDQKIFWLRRASDISKIKLDQKLLRLLQNIFENAIESQASRISIEAKFQSAGLLLQIMDNGVGVPRDIVAKLGHAAVPSCKTNGSGKGLFLICTELRRQQVAVKFFSEKEQGTLVQIEIPETYLSSFLKVQA